MSAILNRIHWFMLWIAYQAVLRLPMFLFDRKFPLWWWLAPYGGQYAHTQNFTEFQALAKADAAERKVQKLETYKATADEHTAALIGQRAELSERAEALQAVIETQEDSIAKLERKVQHWQERAEALQAENEKLQVSRPQLPPEYLKKLISLLMKRAAREEVDEPGKFWTLDAAAMREASRALATLTKRIEEIRAETIQECAKAAEMTDRIGYEWVKDSLWANVLKRSAASVRALLNTKGESDA